MNIKSHFSPSDAISNIITITNLLHDFFSVSFQEEISFFQVAGKGGEVRWDMRSQLPYTMATIKEIQRFADIAPTGLMHKTVVDVNLDGFSLPQECVGSNSIKDRNMG